MPQPQPHPTPDQGTDRAAVLVRWGWLILKNLIGWPLIVLSVTAGPLVPGPGGIPMFLIGFALISFPGKRRLTARVLRGRPFQIRHRAFILGSLLASLAVAAVLLSLLSRWTEWLDQVQNAGWWTGLILLPLAAAAVWVCMIGLVAAANALLRFAPRVRRRVRPWLRRHHIHLLPPRRRRRMPHEPGHGPHRVGDGILRFSRRHSAS